MKKVNKDYKNSVALSQYHSEGYVSSYNSAYQNACSGNNSLQYNAYNNTGRIASVHYKKRNGKIIK